MTDTLISFETAKLAKEKGFFVQKHLYFIHENSVHYEGTYENRDFSVVKEHYLNNTIKGVTKPTQSLLQKWIREKHNMHILMNVGMNNGEKQTFYCNVFKFGKNLYISKFRSKTSVYTYEEVLEIGLCEALKLIK